jgi:DNA helicase-2/ATP-dependent DNA helicase PcrA
MDILLGLNSAQKEAVTAGPGPVLVLAGPGSGKTRVLTHRVAYLIRQLKVPPWNIMAVTFTNKAAKEMKARASELLDGSSSGLTMGTFHAACVRILRRESDALTKYGRDFVIFDTDDQRQVVKQSIKDLNLDEKMFTPPKLLNRISAAKNELITAEEYAASNYVSEITHRVYERYQKILIANNAMDFDDLLMNTVLLFDQGPEILERYRGKYLHVLVDEFQDTNTAQYELLGRLAGGHRNIFVVGDADQSIYRWRGANFRNINRFRQQYSDAQQILLEQNYRSTQIILDAAKAIIRHNPDRVDKELFTDRQGGSLISVREAYNEVEEAEMVVEQIEQLKLQGIGRRDCAVMYRTNAQSRVLEEAFIRAQINYRLVNATRFYARREIKDIIAYLRVVHNPADSISFTRMINTPPRGIGPKTMQTLQNWAKRQDNQPGEALLQLISDAATQHPFNNRAFRALDKIGRNLKTWMALKDTVTVADLMDTIIEGAGYGTYIDDGTDEGHERWANVLELRGLAMGFEELNLSEFLEQVALVSDVDDLEENPDAPTLLTLHAAKGLEFPVVFIVGLEEGMLPHSWSMEDAEELAEERRLFYVGLTRAKDRVFLTHAFRRTFYGMTEVASPSRFLLEIPDELLEGGTTSERRQDSIERVSSWKWESKKPFNRVQNISGRKKELPEPSSWRLKDDKVKRPSTAEAEFKTGQKVRHAKFGEGIVIESKLTGSDEEVIVAFSELGVKKLVASLAKLKIVK